MTSVTLAESAKLAQDELVEGIIESIVTVNQMFEVLPFDGIDGNSLKYNRENALGGAVVAGVGADLLTDTLLNPISGATTAGQAKNPASFTEVNTALTSILADAEVNGLIQATRSNPNDQASVQIASKAKHVGRIYQHMLINGDGLNDTFEGLLTLCAGSQTIAPAGANGDQLAFATLDALISLVVAKDGRVDYFAMNDRERNFYFELLRGLGGAGIGETVELPSGEEVAAYRNVPMFRNDYIPINQTVGTSNNATTIFAGCVDDGSRSNGLAGLTAANASGIRVVDVGEKENRDEHQWRVVWYASAANFSDLGLACANGIIP